MFVGLWVLAIGIPTLCPVRSTECHGAWSVEFDLCIHTPGVPAPVRGAVQVCGRVHAGAGAIIRTERAAVRRCDHHLWIPVFGQRVSVPADSGGVPGDAAADCEGGATSHQLDRAFRGLVQSLVHCAARGGRVLRAGAD